MIITVQGTHKGNNGAVGVVSALSALTVANRQKKTLVLQLINKTDNNVQNILTGAKIKNETLNAEMNIDDIENGIDALMIHSAGGKITPDIFTQCTKNLVKSVTDNMYDLAYSSDKTDFEAEFLLRKDSFKNFFKNASDVYDIIYVLLPSKDKVLCNEVMEYADANVVCVRQKNAETYNKGKKDFFIVTDFEDTSVYNVKTMKKFYGVKTIHGLMHNVAYKDAVSQGNLLNFLMKNTKNTKADSNYYFSHYINVIIDDILGKEKIEEDVDIEKMADKDSVISYQNEKEEIPTENIQEVTKKKGLFGKRKLTTIVKPDEE